jgi:hypothetical protein
LYVCPFSYRSTCIASAWLAGRRVHSDTRRSMSATTASWPLVSAAPVDVLISSSFVLPVLASTTPLRCTRPSVRRTMWSHSSGVRKLW